ncbi:MAG TPA: HAMP domain-containing sensor histidine kinase, partial [Kofleriaceae bacterium]
HVVFYGGWPLVTSDNHALGSLCVIDRKPRDLTETQKRSMALLARQVVVSLELRRAQVASPLDEVLAKHQQLEALNLARGRLARLVVHDLKNPLMTIGGNASYVRESPALDATEKQALDDIMLAAERMQAMLLDVLDVDRSVGHDGQLVARRSKFACKELVTQVVGSGYSHAYESKIRVEVREDERVTADRNLVGRILSNLVDNAQRYAPAGSEIVVSWQRVPGGSELVVADCGLGICDADKPRVFDPYIQLDNHRTGRGLGLVFCRLAASAHGGSIRIEDNEPRGTRFCVVLPD